MLGKPEEHSTADWAHTFEALRVYYVRTCKSVETGELERSWPILKSLALACPHFVLDWSTEYTPQRLSEKLAAHFIHALCLAEDQKRFEQTSPAMFTLKNGDELMVRAALNWSPRARFKLDELQAVSDDWQVVRLLEGMVNSDQLAFDALGIALDLLAKSAAGLSNPATILLSGFLRQELVRPQGKQGKRPKAQTVYRRFATRLFLHEMNALKFEMGSARECQTGEKAVDAAYAALKHHGHKPPAVGTLLEDWNDWHFKGT